MNIISQICYEKNPLLFDIGGNSGDWSLSVIKKIKNAEIHMFEPSLSVFDKARIVLQNYNVRINNLAVSDKVGNRNFFVYGTSSISSLHRNEDFLEHQIDIVKTTTIDNYCFSNDLEFINYLKIDTEGHDLYVLKGAKKMLDNKKIDCVQFEYGPGNIHSRVLLKDILNYLSNKNYLNFRLYPSWIKPVGKYSIDLENYVLVNYISVSPNIVGKIERYIRK